MQRWGPPELPISGEAIGSNPPPGPHNPRAARRGPRRMMWAYRSMLDIDRHRLSPRKSVPLPTCPRTATLGTPTASPAAVAGARAVALAAPAVVRALTVVPRATPPHQATGPGDAGHSSADPGPDPRPAGRLAWVGRAQLRSRTQLHHRSDDRPRWGLSREGVRVEPGKWAREGGGFRSSLKQQPGCRILVRFLRPRLSQLHRGGTGGSPVRRFPRPAQSRRSRARDAPR